MRGSGVFHVRCRKLKKRRSQLPNVRTLRSSEVAPVMSWLLTVSAHMSETQRDADCDVLCMLRSCLTVSSCLCTRRFYVDLAFSGSDVTFHLRSHSGGGWCQFNFKPQDEVRAGILLMWNLRTLPRVGLTSIIPTPTQNLVCTEPRSGTVLFALSYIDVS